jgi:hypothetical protein
LSFGSETGRTRSGTKGFSGKAKKQLKRKKQEYHKHRGRLQESENLNPEELSARTVLVLDRLGHQVLSTEPGGYDLEAWLRSLNSLLDDFEEKIGEQRVTDEFRKRREDALIPLSAQAASGDLNSEIRQLIDEETAAVGVLSDLEKQAAAKLASLRERRDACGTELRLEKEKLAQMREAKQSRQFLSRFMRSGPSTADGEQKVVELEARMRGLEDEIERSRKARMGNPSGSPDGADPARLEAQDKLQSIQKRLLELQSATQDKLQLAREREVATKSIADAISSMKTVDPLPNEGEIPRQ